MTRVFYAIGDVHGEAERLSHLHQLVLNDFATSGAGFDPVLVHLGDYVDRGPDSAGVVAAVRGFSARAGWQVINLRGNHEQMMLDALISDDADAEAFWLRNGGRETLESYEAIGAENLADDLVWMGQLARVHHAEADGFVFVHAGIDPDTFPLIDERVSLWTRSPRFFETGRWQNAALDGMTVIHGHTPTLVPLPDRTADGRRINVDTGAVYGGALTAVRLSRGATPYFLQA